MSPFSRTIKTRHADISVVQTAELGSPVLLIHGNSTCKEVFRHQLSGPLAERYRLIAMDLPGHGQSSNAEDPAETYSIPGYADAALEVMEALDARKAAVLGWSLGGHIALEMIHRAPEIAGLMIIGTPPVARGIFGMMRGFHSPFDLLLATRSRLSPREIERFAHVCFGDAVEPDFLRMIERTDERARPLLFRDMLKGTGADQKWIVEHSPTPLAVVNGSEEPFARLDHVAGLAYRNLWSDRCHVIDGAGHAPFLELPEVFEPIFQRFLDDLAERHPAVAPSGAGEGRRFA